MRSFKTIAVAIALIGSAACADHHTDTNSDPGGATSVAPSNNTGGGAGGGSGSGSGGSAAACPLGAARFTDALGLSNPDQLLSLAIDLHGNMFVAGSQGGANPDAQHVSGVFAVSATGEVQQLLQLGSLVAVDAQGDLIIAGSFTDRIDLGLGIGTMIPNGDIDVFVVKLGASGKVIFAKQLGMCGDGIAALAVDRDGRIAISGSAMGTVVLTASGDVDLQIAEVGKLAFDSQGNLAIAGSIDASAGGGAFVMMVDRTGAQVFSHTFVGTGVTIGGIAIDANDRIAIVGTTTDTIDLFGTVIQARSATESGRVSGAFLVMLDASCNALVALDLGMVEANAVAFGPSGDIFIAGALAGNTGFFRINALVKVDTRGVLTSLQPESYGRDLAVAVDACGSIYLGMVKMDSPSPISAIRALVTKISE